MSSRRAKIRSPKNYDTTCAIEAHHDYPATTVLTAALSYIPSFVSFPLPAALENMVPTTHSYMVRCAKRIIGTQVSETGVSNDAAFELSKYSFGL